mgnify:CR=1 FL=1
MQSAVSAALRRVQAPVDEPLCLLFSSTLPPAEPVHCFSVWVADFFLCFGACVSSVHTAGMLCLFSILECTSKKAVVCIDLIQIFQGDFSMHDACRMQPVMVQFFLYTSHSCCMFNDFRCGKCIFIVFAHRKNDSFQHISPMQSCCCLNQRRKTDAVYCFLTGKHFCT